MKVKLDVGEQNIVRYHANRIQSNHEDRSGIGSDPKISPENGRDITVRGLGGEFAFAKYYGLAVDWRLGITPYFDLEYHGFRIDVKTHPRKWSTLDRFQMLIAKRPPNLPDIYVLMIEEEWEFEFFGWEYGDFVWKKIVFSKEITGRPGFAFPANSLRSFEEFEFFV